MMKVTSLLLLALLAFSNMYGQSYSGNNVIESERQTTGDDAYDLYILGNRYYHDDNNRDRNIMKAFNLWLEAAEKGCAEAQVMVGYCYGYDAGVFSGDYDRRCLEAYNWFSKAAEQGNSDAFYYLGEASYNGYGVKQNYKDAFMYYEKSAVMGNYKGMLGLGKCYEYGHGIKKNISQAIFLYERCIQGEDSVAADLATFYLSRIKK